MSFFTGFFNQLGQERQHEFARTSAEEANLRQLEMRVLEQLAQGEDDEVAALAGAGLLESLSGRGRIEKAKGMRGFLGEAARSSYLPQIQALLQGRRGSTPATPGGAVLPAGSPVEPDGPQMDPVSMAGFGLPPTPTRGGPPPKPAGVAAAEVTSPGMPERPDLGGPELAGMTPMPQPPESNTARNRRLYPSASEVAVQTTRAKAMAEYQAVIEALQMAKATGDPDVRRAMLGRLGAPEPAIKPELFEVDYLDPVTGTALSSIGQRNGQTGQIEVDGVPVRPLRARPVNQRPTPARAVQRNVDGKIVTDFVDPVAGTSVATDMPVKPVSQLEGPIIQEVGGQFRTKAGTTERVQVGGPAPVRPRATMSPEDKAAVTKVKADARGLKSRIDTLIKNEIDTLPANPLRSGRPSLALTRQDALTKRESKGQFETYAEMVAAIASGTLPDRAPAAPAAFGAPGGEAAIKAALANLGKKQ